MTPDQFRELLTLEADRRCGPDGWAEITVVFDLGDAGAETVTVRNPRRIPV